MLRQGIMGVDTNMDEIQEIGERCEKVAKLRVQLEQQLEERIEIPPHNF